MHLFGEFVDMDHDPEKETCKLCSDMPDGGRMRRCCSQREPCRQDLEAGSSKAYGRCWLFSWAAAQNAGMHWWGMEPQVEAGARLAALNKGENRHSVDTSE